MRIVWKECRKILNIKLLFVMAAFTFLFYYLYLWVPVMYSYNMSEISLNKSLYEELMEEIGPAISMEEYDRELQQKKQQLSLELDELVKENAVFSEMGFHSYEEMTDYVYSYEDMPREEWNKEQKRCYEERSDFIFEEMDSSKLVFWIQEIDRMGEFRDFYGQTDQEAARSIQTDLYDGYSEKQKEREMELLMRQEISLVPDWVMEYLSMDDMPMLAALILIYCLVLVIPYQIRERINHVLPVYASTKTGRKIFPLQVAAVIGSCTFVCLVQFAVYTLFCWLNGVLVFWSCPAGSLVHALWVDMTFGEYYLLYCLLVWVAVISFSLVAYMVSRWSANYIIGIAAAIPMAVCCVLYFHSVLRAVYNVEGGNTYWIHWTVFGMLALWGIVLFGFLKRDGKRDF